MISERGFLEGSLEGINNMEIGLDFLVRPDPIFTETDDSGSGSADDDSGSGSTS